MTRNRELVKIPRIGDRLYVTDKRFDRFVLAIALWENGLLNTERNRSGGSSAIVN